MVKSSKTKSEDKRKPKHGLDSSRPSKGGKNKRDAATVRFLQHLMTAPSTCMRCRHLLWLVWNLLEERNGTADEGQVLHIEAGSLLL